MNRAVNRDAEFGALHEAGLLVLPNAWDAASARLAEAAGAQAVATTSAGVAWSLGWPDGDVLPVAELAAAVGRIARVVRVPVSADIEGGYADAAGTARAVMDAGAVGVNIEDGAGPPETLAAKIGAVRGAAERAGVRLFINARTDLWLRGIGAEEGRVDEAVRRAELYRAAGADGLFAPGLADEEATAMLAAACGLPLNIMAAPGVAPPARLEQLGVRRFSAGAAIALEAWGFVAGRTAELMGGSAAALGYGQMNGLFVR